MKTVKIEEKIIFEDNKILVVQKPPGTPVQSDSSKDLDLLSLLKEYIKEKYNKPGNAYLGLVHRLDRPVGGIMIFAKNSKSAKYLSEQIRNHTFKKTYLAIVHGKLKTRQAELRDYLLKDSNTNKVSVVSKDIIDAKEAVLRYKVLEETNNLSLLRIELKTGRPHQIRVQLANFGNPLYGDSKYGNGSSARDGIGLLSYKIKFEHPGTKETLEFKSNIPTQYPWNQFKKLQNQQM